MGLTMNSSVLEIQRIRTPQNRSIGTSSLINSEQIVNLEATSSVYTTRNLSPAQKDPLIENYFRSGFQERISSRRRVALRLKSFDSVFLVLEWSQRGDVDDAYDAAVDLLAECEEVLIGALQYLYLEYPREGRDRARLEIKLDVLISGLARASRLSCESRLRAITALMGCESRIVKTAIIDAIAKLEHKRNKKQVRGILEWFASPNQFDTYVREYAKEALEDLE